MLDAVYLTVTKDKAFESFILDSNDPQIKELIRTGYDGLDFMKT